VDLFTRPRYGLRQNSAYRISQLEIAGKIMSKKITWPSLFFGPINLWSCPRQEELNTINAMKDVAYYHDAASRVHRFNADTIEAAIKEREFLYYLHSGRFPE
jgi:hypothetical protein